MGRPARSAPETGLLLGWDPATANRSMDGIMLGANMMRLQIAIVSALVGIAAAAGVIAFRKASPTAADDKQADRRTPVIVELFTSEG